MSQLTLTLPPETAARIAEEAAARGVTPEAIATEAVEAWMAADDLGWDEGPEPESENVSLDEAFDALEARIAAARAAANK
jgi:hypothetical protein